MQIVEGANACAYGRGGGVTHHSIKSYQEKLVTYLEQLTLQPRPLGSAAAREALPVDPADPCSLFRLSPATDDSGGHAVLDELGRSAGAHFCTVSKLEIGMEILLPFVALCNRLTASGRVLLTQAYLVLGYWQPQCKSIYAAIVCTFWSNSRLCMRSKSCRLYRCRAAAHCCKRQGCCPNMQGSLVQLQQQSLGRWQRAASRPIGRPPPLAQPADQSPPHQSQSSTLQWRHQAQLQQPVAAAGRPV